MRVIPSATVSAWLVLAPLLGGCAHGGAGQAAAPAGPAPSEVQEQSAAEPKRPARVLVTGSRIPRPVEPRGQVPVTDTPLRVHSREQIDATGRDGDLGAALQTLDPAVTIRR